jgi:hypothetical protein
MRDALPALVDAKQIALETGWTPDEAKHWIRREGLPIVRRGRRVYVRRDDAARALEAKQT